jgi:hypothetical protein
MLILKIMRNTCLTAILLCFVGIITSGTQCRQDSPPMPKNVYAFSEKLSLFPFKKVYAPGDTIRIRLQNTDKTLFDKLSGKRIRIDTTFLKGIFNIDQQYPQENNFDLPGTAMVENGTGVNFSPYLPGRNVLTFNTECSSNSYFFEVALMVNKKGIFTITPGAVLSACPEKKEMLPTSFLYTFDLDDCNKSVWQPVAEQVRGYSINYIDVGIDRKEIFAFKVE